MQIFVITIGWLFAAFIALALYHAFITNNNDLEL